MPQSLSFPRTFPEGSVQTVVDHLENRVTDRWAVAAAAYDLLGYALYQAKTANSPATAVPGARDAAFELRSLITQHQRIAQQTAPTQQAQAQDENQTEPAPVPVRAGAVNIPPWLLAFVLQVLQRVVTT